MVLAFPWGPCWLTLECNSVWLCLYGPFFPLGYWPQFPVSLHILEFWWQGRQHTPSCRCCLPSPRQVTSTQTRISTCPQVSGVALLAFQWQPAGLCLFFASESILPLGAFKFSFLSSGPCSFNIGQMPWGSHWLFPLSSKDCEAGAFPPTFSKLRATSLGSCITQESANALHVWFPTSLQSVEPAPHDHQKFHLFLFSPEWHLFLGQAWLLVFIKNLQIPPGKKYG